MRKLTTPLLLAAIAALSPSPARVITWLTSDTGAWTDPANWSTNAVPTDTLFNRAALAPDFDAFTPPS